MSSRRRPYSKRQPAEDYDRALAGLSQPQLTQQQLLDSINDKNVLEQVWPARIPPKSPNNSLSSDSSDSLHQNSPLGIAAFVLS